MLRWRKGREAIIASMVSSLEDQRRQLPDQPGVYLFKDDDGGGALRRQGDGRSASAWPRTSPGPHRGGLAFIDQVASIDFLVTETEAEALLAEQQFIKRHRPRFNIRLRDDKSYPYVGVSLDEEFPRVYFTRERHRSGRVYFGPFSSAKRVRETLDLLGKLFQYRTCEGPEPGRRSGVPCLDYYIKRCQAPCVGYIDREEYRRNIEAIIDFLSGRYRDVERDLERKMAEASGAEEFERAAIYRDRLEAVRSLMQRRSVAGESLETADLIAVAVDGHGANAQVFQVRDGVLAERQGFYLANEGGARRGRGDRGVRRPVLLGGARGAAAGGRGPRAARSRRPARRGAVVAAVAGRSRCASPSEATSGACASWPSATRGSPWPRTSCAPSGVASSGSTRSSAPPGGAGSGLAARADRGLRRLQPRRRPHRGLDGRVRGRRAEEGRLRRFKFRAIARRDGRPRGEAEGRRALTTSPRWRRCWGGAPLSLLRAGRPLAARSRARRELRGASRPDRDRRRQGAAVGRACARSRRWSSGGRP